MYSVGLRTYINQSVKTQICLEEQGSNSIELHKGKVFGEECIKSC